LHWGTIHNVLSLTIACAATAAFAASVVVNFCRRVGSGWEGRFFPSPRRRESMVLFGRPLVPDGGGCGSIYCTRDSARLSTKNFACHFIRRSRSAKGFGRLHGEISRFSYFQCTALQTHPYGKILSDSFICHAKYSNCKGSIFSLPTFSPAI
jgi:hypothetical protein